MSNKTNETHMNQENQYQKYIGAIILPLRLVAGWLFFSAFWRRVVLVPEKHIMETPQWLGHKINTFYPHSNGLFKTMLGRFLENPDEMNIFTYVFTYSELLAGLLLVAGFLSRLSGLLLVGLAVGLMHTAGWLGPTCLDEWQISSMLVAIGVVITLFGSGRYSLDSLISQRKPGLNDKRWWQLLTLPMPAANNKLFRNTTYAVSLAVILYVMGMNQVHHGGVWGKLHNYSKIPDIQVMDYQRHNDSTFSLRLYRGKGPETYGSFIIKTEVKNEAGKTLHTFDQSYMKNIGKPHINNTYINEIKPGAHSLVIPLGAKGKVTFHLPDSVRLNPNREYSFVLTDISGRTFAGPQ